MFGNYFFCNGGAVMDRSEFVKKVRATKCSKDYRGRHFFSNIGVFRLSNSIICQVHKCEQCKKIVYEELEEINLKAVSK